MDGAVHATPTGVVLRTRGPTRHGGVHARADAVFELRRDEHVAIMGDKGEAEGSGVVAGITAARARNAAAAAF